MGRFAALIVLLFMPFAAFASENAERLDLTGNWSDIASVMLFFVACLAIMVKELFAHLRKSKPVMLVVGIIWGLIAWHYQSHDITHLAETALRQV